MTITTNTNETLTLAKSGKAAIFTKKLRRVERVAYVADEDGSCWYRLHGQWNEALVVDGTLHESVNTRCA